MTCFSAAGRLLRQRWFDMYCNLRAWPFRCRAVMIIDRCRVLAKLKTIRPSVCLPCRRIVHVQLCEGLCSDAGMGVYGVEYGHE